MASEIDTQTFDERDLVKCPYTHDEARVAEWLVTHTGIGAGNDPIGFLLLSHQALAAQRDAAQATLREREKEVGRLRQALSRIEGWEMPRTGKYHDDGTEQSYSWCYGSNGARDVIRKIARSALATPAPEAPNAAVREADSALWTEDHRQKMAQEASAILDEMRQGAPKDGE